MQASSEMIAKWLMVARFVTTTPLAKPELLTMLAPKKSSLELVNFV
jgi:hypothetical protein